LEGGGGTAALGLVAFGEEGDFFEALGEEGFFDLGEGIVAEATCSSSDSSFITLLLFFAGSEGLRFSNRQHQKCTCVRSAISSRFDLLDTSASPSSSLFASTIIKHYLKAHVLISTSSLSTPLSASLSASFFCSGGGLYPAGAEKNFLTQISHRIETSLVKKSARSRSNQRIQLHDPSPV
jgi:hypothetical protein